MKRIAFFVEGQTEQLFVYRLVKEILGHQHVNVMLKQYVGGTKIPKQELTKDVMYASNPRYEVLISNCGADNRVKSEIIENISNLRAKGYSMIVGLRDLYPIPIEDYEKLEYGLKFLPNQLRQHASSFDIIIAIHEIEAWFLAETNHLKKVDKRLNGPFIKERLGFNPYAIDPQLRVHPAKDLNDIYNLVGKSYAKRFWQVNKLVNRLDFGYLRNSVRYKIEPLNTLISIIEDFKEKK